MTIAGPLLAEDQDRPYEYRTFKVGDRVRVRLSGECRAGFETKSPQAEHGIWGHFPVVDGMTGYVYSINPPDYIGGVGKSHPYDVQIDGGFYYLGEYFHADDFASAELEPLDPEATR